ncbi:MAG: hypothetical protein JNL83_01575 [Myxococcales bacterium]|nr:hypothetical protein [Myxococcales bacterium]
MRRYVFASAATAMSGVAALFYQLAWVRELTGVTTAATIALVLVVAAFMAGLGLGAWLGGKLLRRGARPLVAYAIVELGAALMFVLGVLVLRGSLALQHVLIDGGLSPGAALAVQLAAVGLYLAAATTLLGMALPLLVAGVGDESVTAARLYGINTVGAVVGALACGYVTIELLGLRASIVIGAAGSVASALCALLAGGKPAPRLPDAPAERTSRISVARLAIAVANKTPITEESIAAPEPSVTTRALVAAAVTGAIALAAEVLWARMLSLVMLNTVYAATQVLACVLAGIAIAGLVAARVARRPRETILRVAAWALVAAAVWLACVPLLTRTLAGTDSFAGLAASGRSPVVIASLAAILVPGSALLALVLPLLVAATGRHAASRSMARLFAVNTLGAVAGALGMGLVVLPLLGLAGAQAVLVGAALAAVTLVPGRTWRMLLVIVPAAAGAVVLQLAITLPDDLYRLRFERDETVLELREGITSDVLVTQDPQGHRRIWINSAWVAGTGGGHALLGHLPALSTGRPVARALGIALGTGQTFGAVLQHGTSRLDCVEINADVVELSRRWFGAFNGGLFDRDGVTVHLEDGRAFLRGTREHYDLIVLEPLQAWSAGTTALYTREFYADARRRLADGGVLAQWIPFYGQDTQATRAMVATALAVFPDAALWLDEKDGILLLFNGPVRIPWPSLRDRLPPELLVQKHLDARTDVLSLFLMGPRGLAAWTAGADLIEDDRPFLEYAAARDLHAPSFAETLASAQIFFEDPRDYLTLADDTTDALRARRATATKQLCTPERVADCAIAVEAELGSRSERVHYMYRQLVLAWAEQLRSDRARREEVLARGIARDPDFGEAMVNLAVSLAQRGERATAETLARRAAAIPRTRAQAERVLDKLRAP